MPSAKLLYKTNHAVSENVRIHLEECGDLFIPPLGQRVNIEDYALKIAGQAETLEAWNGQDLVGLIAVYCNDADKRTAYITSVSVKEQFGNMGIASELLIRCIRHVQTAGFSWVVLEVDEQNEKGRGLYINHGFEEIGKNGRSMIMRRKIG